MLKKNINLHKKTFTSLTSKEENFIFENFDEVSHSLIVGNDISPLKKYKDIENKQEKKYFFREFMKKKEKENCYIFLLYKTPKLTKFQILIGFAIVCNNLISYLVINKKFRNQKNGTYLIKELQKIFFKLEVRVEINNPKLKEFYKKNNFKENSFYEHPFPKQKFFLLKWSK